MSIIIDILTGTMKLRDAWPKINSNFTGIKTEVDAIVTGSANAEVGQAHVSTVKSKTFTTLDDRLEEDEQDLVTYKAETTTELLLKRDKATPIKGSELDTSSEANKIQPLNVSDALMTMFSPAGTVSPVIPLKSVGKDKLSFVPVEGTIGKNKFNKNTVTAGKYIDNSNGNLVTSATYHASAPMFLLPDTLYKRVRNTLMAFYDSNGAFISGIVSDLTFTTPANQLYTRISISTDAYLLIEQVELGAVSTAYEDYVVKSSVTSIPDNSISQSSLTPERKKDSFTQVKFGINPAYVASYPWVEVISGTSTAEWVANDATLLEGDYYLKLTRGDTNIAGMMLRQEIPDAYKGLTSVKARVLVNYSSTIPFSLEVYQEAMLTEWCNPNTSVNIALPSTGGIEKQVELIVPILWDGNYLVPFLTDIRTVGVVKIGSIKYSILGNEVVLATPTTTVTVKPSGGDYSSIQSAINDVTGSQVLPVNVMVYPATYTEELVLKDWVNLIGVSQDDCIIQSLPTVGDTVNRDTIKANKNALIKNLTVKGENVKYCIHDDSAGDHILTIENCVLDKKVVDDYGSAIGTGLRGKQHIKIKNSTIRGDTRGIYYHNWDDQTEYGSLEIENSTIEGTSEYGLYVQSLGSNMADLVILKGSKFVGGMHDIRVGRNVSYGYNQDDIVFLASGNEINTYAKSEGSNVPLVQPMVVATVETVI